MKAADWVLARPWAITEEALGVILSIAERTNESPEAVEARLGRPMDNTRECVVRDGVAIIPVIGPISRYADFFSRISGATDIETLAKDFRTCLDDRSVRAIVLNMDTPGGTVAGVSEFASHVMQARGTKPIVSYVGSQAASAGYWIASAADQIVADSTAMLGSIGVVMGVRKPADDKPGAAKTIQFVSSQSPRKRPDPETEAGRSQMQAMADDTADVFVDAVACHRGVDRQKVLDDFGRGGQLVGSKAVDAGMADGLGSLESVIACLSKGEMPCPPRKPKPAPQKAETQPRRAAMSEPETMSAAEAAELRKQIAALQASARESDAIKARLDLVEQTNAELAASNQKLAAEKILAEANAFARDMTTGRHACAMPAERARIAEEYLRNASVDARIGEPVTYTLEGKSVSGSHLDAFKAGFKLRPRVTVRDESLVILDLPSEPESDATDDGWDKAFAAEAARRNGKK